MECSSARKSSLEEPIAIIGSGCRFPGSANDPSKLWDLLHNPHDVLTTIPKERFNPQAFYHPNGMHHGTSNVTEAYLLQEDYRVFDASFFNITPVEAHSMDPQQRLLLETVYESLESAGIPMEALSGSQTGVYVGLMCGDYGDHLQRDINSMPTYTASGTARSIVSNRVSYFFNWHGPSMTIDTACSSSLVAVHQAVQLLRSGDSEVAVAAGANIMLGPEWYISESNLKMLSPSGRCRMWDADADGYARGEGVAAIVMKRLSTAIKDGDHIECIIRGTGVNQDGRTKGITMPSHIAQADLIAKTYSKAGLDPRQRNERCQYFEAHGTGTVAGDATEAEAISKAFFGPDGRTSDEQDILYAGSIKSIIGHTEGTAGIAGVLKASLAVQHGVIPPNTHFNTLNPAVAPFYHNLEIVTTARDWPKIAPGIPRRASVNSFGFGGTNAHVIIENFVSLTPNGDLCSPVFTPFTFSAASEQALQVMLTTYLEYIQNNPSLNLPDLSYTLHTRRSALPVRIAFSATSSKVLAAKIEQHLELSTKKANENAKGNTAIGVRPSTAPPRILGVFTGQGAQWATMARELLLKSKYARQFMEDLDIMLNDLPEYYRPSWSLVDEILADSSNSRLDEPFIVQPLSTAIQILLVDLLTNAGVMFEAVVGHSSGEVAAAYAAGLITCHEAIKIAYYRGMYTKLFTNDKKGTMMAVGTSLEDAIELCSLPMFEGRICVAACNSSSSVTLSGDLDAIEEAKVVFEDEKKFARILKLDKAYHSHHMIPCSVAYAEALSACNVHPQQRGHTCTWFSSTYKGAKMEARDELKASYWAENMVSPVLFSQAVEAAVSQKGPFNIAIEVGPHPALKGPVAQILQDISGQSIPYTGLMSRGTDDIEALSSALGFIWTQFSSPVVNFNQYDALVSRNESRRVLKGLPTYCWDHSRLFWHDSRTSKAFRFRKDAPHSLLGSRIVDEAEEEMRWRNILRPADLPWIRDHRLQGQMIFPAAGYIATAVEASKLLADDISIGLIEVCDFLVKKPLTFEDDESGVEIMFSLSEISKNHPGIISAVFTYHAYTNQDSTSLTNLASGRIIVTIGKYSPAWLPSPSPEPPGMVPVTTDQFYSSLESIGYGYSGGFKALSAMRRKLDFGSAELLPQQYDQVGEPLLVHPAMLDSALQFICLAYSWPGDGSLQQLHVPTSIQNIRINVSLLEQELASRAALPLASHLTENPLTSSAIHGDIDIYSTDLQSTLIQVEGVRMVPFTEGSADRQLFSAHVWAGALPDVEIITQGCRASRDDYELATVLERVALFYFKNLDTVIKETEQQNLAEHHLSLLKLASHILSRVKTGTQPHALKEWLNDTREQVSAIMDRYPDNMDMRLLRTVGESLPAAIRGEIEILDCMLGDDLLSSYYTNALGLKECTEFLATTVAQIVHRYPHMSILEIGAGTGATTKAVMRHIGQTFSTYTFTDFSSAFFSIAKKAVDTQADKINFKVLNIERDITEQGYSANSYDLVIAVMALHATSNLKNTLENTRKLLRPGGYLLLLEGTNNDVLRLSLTMGGLPGWWLGINDGRPRSPCVSSMAWHSLLLRTGFSGIDSTNAEVDILPRPFSIMVSQAVDKRVKLLRNPSEYPGSNLGVDKWDLIVLGGNTLRTRILIDKVIRLLQLWDISILQIPSLHDIDSCLISPTSVILSLTELDKPIFQDFTYKTMDGLKKLFDYQRTILWVTQGCKVGDEPYMNMTMGLGRSLILERPDVRLQFLDLDVSETPSPQLIIETLLRLRLIGAWEAEGTLDNLLWSSEHEIAYEKGRPMLPRLIMDEARNNRYNTPRKALFERKNLENSAICLQASPSGYSLIQDDAFTWSFGSKENLWSEPKVTIQASYSFLLPLVSSQSHQLYGVLGIETRTGQTLLGLCDSNCSRVTLPQDKIIDCGLAKGKETQLLSLLDTELKVDNILSSCGHNSVLILHEPSPALAARLLDRASEKRLTVSFTTSDQAPLSDSWITVHPRSPRRAIKVALPPDVSIFIDCSGSEHLGSLIASCLPSSCWQTTLNKVHAQAMGINLTEQDLIRELKFIVNRALSNLSTATISICPVVLGPEDITGHQSTQNFDSTVVVDWTAAVNISLKISSVDSQISFGKDRTYILFGLTSDLGQSLCDWMVSHGARNLVLTSRSPNIATGWLEQMKLRGVRLEVFSNDITNEIAVKGLVSKIQRTFPPIAGIVNGAMVLDDASFFDMTFERMEKVLKPKVQGSIYLNELFQEDTLDFFIFFSSIAAVMGNRGQSNYAAANMFMAGIASQRHQKGLAASVVHLGAILGLGYITRNISESIIAGFRNFGFSMLSERDFHLCIAEAILAGRPGSGLNPEIVTGLQILNAENEVQLPWRNDPRFQHCLLRGVSDIQVKTGRGTASIPTKIRLLEAVTKEEVLEIVKDAFFGKLQAALQLSLESDVARNQVLNSGAGDLGIDSLVAVELRSWFLKDLEIDMPVFKFLGGAPMVALLAFALGRIASSLTPNLKVTTSAAASTLLEVETQISAPPDAPAAETMLPAMSTSVISNTTSENDRGSWSITTPTDSMNSSLSVPARGLQKILPMSPRQASVWFLKHYLDDQTVSNVTFSLQLKGDIRIHDLENAVKMMGVRHEALRTCFFTDEYQKPVQGVLETPLLHLETLAIKDTSQVSQEFESMRNHVFDIERGEVMKILFLSLTPTANFLVIGFHHVNMDGASFDVFLSDLELAYNHQALPQPVTQYTDFSLKEQRDLENGSMKEEKEFWRAQFSESLPPLPLLPFSSTRSRMSIIKYEHNHEACQMDANLAAQITKMCHRHKANEFHFYLAVFEVLLLRLLDTRDLCIGMASANRNDEPSTKSMGLYLNFLPLRFRLSPNQTFGDILKETRKTAYSAMAYSRLPFDVLLDEIKAPRSASHSPLFQAFINYRAGNEIRKFGDFEGFVKESDFGRTAYDINLDILDSPNSHPLITFMVQKQLYSTSDAKRLSSIYFNLLRHFSEAPTSRLDEPSLFGIDEIENAIELGRGPKLVSNWPETLVHRIEDIVVKQPEAIALKDTIGNSWTYHQMMNRTNCIAAALLDSNVSSKSPVVVFQEPSPDWICSMLAILRIGAVYVPFDINTPTARLATMLKASQPSAILVHDATAANVEGLDVTESMSVLNISSLSKSTSEIIQVMAHAGNAAAILFTSGTTGIPKGVVLSHYNLLNQIEAVIALHKFGSETVLQQSALSFDVSLDQIFTALSNGGTLVIAPRSIRGDSVAISKVVVEEGVTYTHATPSEYLSWLQYGSEILARSKNWRYALSIGEQYPTQLLESFQKLWKHFDQPLRLFNVYGPTEIAIACNRIELPFDYLPDKRIVAGYTLPNYSVYVMDEHLNPMPVGMPGEVCVGGAGLAIGYLNEEQTRQKFIQDVHKPWMRIYQTGDRGVLREDGTLEVLGRVDGDTQLKLRGIRVELEDIESTILRVADGVFTEAIVTPRGEPPILVAHVVFSSSAVIDSQGEFLQRLSSNLPLPQYMQPAAIIPIQSMPLSEHGKIDRRALASLPVPNVLGRSTPNDCLTIESQLRRLWEEVLPIQVYDINTESDFFHVGGNSMLLVKLQEAIRDHFNVSLSIVRLFECSTLGAMAAATQNSTSREASVINWENETAVPQELSVLSRNTPQMGLRKTRTIILTGSTGFLGKEILRQLLTGSINTVHCIAVRNKEKLDEFIDSPKLVIHKGNLELPRLGLSEEDANSIFAEADAIIHNGAEVSFLKSYHSMKFSNVQSTKELLKLSLGRRIPFHFVSSVAVGRLNNEDTFEEVSLASFPPPPGFADKGVDGYAATKWASEVFLENAHASLGLPVWIHRPSNITGEGVGELDVMHNLLTYARIIKAVPESDRWRGYLDSVSIENVTSGIVQEVLESHVCDVPVPLKYVHHCGDMVIPLDSLKSFLGNEDGVTYTGIPLHDWVGEAKKHGLNSLVAEYLSAMDETQVGVNFQRLTKSERE